MFTFVFVLCNTLTGCDAGSLKQTYVRLADCEAVLHATVEEHNQLYPNQTVLAKCVNWGEAV